VVVAGRIGAAAGRAKARSRYDREEQEVSPGRPWDPAAIENGVTDMQRFPPV
jgi:hypothetical protein